MADLITSGLSYTAEDARDAFLQPMFLDPSVLQFFDVLTNVKGSRRITRIGSVEKMTKAHACGWNPSAAAAATAGRNLIMAQVEAEAEQCADQFFNTVLGELLRSGTSRDDLSGTQLQSIIASIFLKGVQRDFNRQMWLGDTGSVDADYNPYDGIFKALDSLPAGQKLVFPAGPIAVDGAIAQFEAMKNAASCELLEDRSNMVMFVSRTVADNYRETLRAGGTEQAFTNLQNGVSNLTWDGIPVVEMCQWDTHISADALATDVHRAVLTTRNNIVIGTDFGANNGADFWYDMKDQLNCFRFGYIAGVQYRADELSVTNIAL